MAGEPRKGRDRVGRIEGVAVPLCAGGAERVHRLEASGIVTGYHASIDLKRELGAAYAERPGTRERREAPRFAPFVGRPESDGSFAAPSQPDAGLEGHSLRLWGSAEPTGSFGGQGGGFPPRTHLRVRDARRKGGATGRV